MNIISKKIKETKANKIEKMKKMFYLISNNKTFQ